MDLILALDLKSWSSVKLGRGARYLRLTDGSLAPSVVMFPCIGSRFAQLELTVLSPVQVVVTCVPLSLRDDGVPWRPGALALFVLLQFLRILIMASSPTSGHRRYRVVFPSAALLRGVFQDYV